MSEELGALAPDDDVAPVAPSRTRAAWSALTAPFGRRSRRGHGAEVAPAAASSLVAEKPRRGRFTPAWSTLALVIGVALAVSSFSVEPGRRPEVVQLLPDTKDASAAGGGDVVAGDPSVAGDTQGPATDAVAAPGGTTRRVPGGSTSGSGGPGTQAGPGPQGVAGGAVPVGTKTPAAIECRAGKNGGSTDTGVTGTSILLGATIVRSGIGESFLGDVRFAMEAVKNKTNRAGGICGRKLELELIDDGWDYNRGGEFIRNLVEDRKVFALSVVPSSEGLENVSRAGYLEKAQVPVVGSDGMLFRQYTDPYIWPVAASTVSTMHIMVKQAYDAGARKFGLVYEGTYHFGIEGAYAFNEAVKRLTGQSVDGYVNPLEKPQCVRRFCGILATQDNYAPEIQQFNGACATDCDFIGMLLEPTTATKWMKGGAAKPESFRRMGGVQPLFTYDFGTACGAACNDLWLWTGYTPPLGDFLSIPAVSTYVNDIKAASSSADYNNQFVLGGYIGMMLTVEALKQTGPHLTRQGLKATLDSMTFDSGGLAPVLNWTPGDHFANTHMRAFSMQYKGGFNGWRDEKTGLADPWVGLDGH